LGNYAAFLSFLAPPSHSSPGRRIQELWLCVCVRPGPSRDSRPTSAGHIIFGTHGCKGTHHDRTRRITLKRRYRTLGSFIGSGMCVVRATPPDVGNTAQTRFSIKSSLPVRLIFIKWFHSLPRWLRNREGDSATVAEEWVRHFEPS
jgi:hypothetical protein